MGRSIMIGAALLCALGGTTAAKGNPLGDDLRINLTIGGGERELARAEARLRAAEAAHADARCKLEELVVRQGQLRGQLAAVERKIADCRNSGNEFEVRQLEARLADVARDSRNLDAELSRLRNLATEAGRAAEAARAEYFREAECDPIVLEARDRITLAQRDLDAARDRALDDLHDDLVWQREASWQDDIARRLEDARRYRTGRYQLEQLERDLAESERRLEAMRQEALACDPGVRDAEARVAAAQRNHDEVWACMERDLAHDRAFAAAVSDQRRIEQDAARVDKALCDARDLMARLEQDLDRLQGSHFIADTRRLEEEAAHLRFSLDCLTGELRAADECLRRADFELRDARRAYEIAVTDCRIPQDRHGGGPGYDRPGYDRGGPDRRDDHKDDRPGRREDDDRRDADRGKADDRHADSKGDDHKGTYRDRGERYERARGEDGRQRTRD